MDEVGQLLLDAEYRVRRYGLVSGRLVVCTGAVCALGALAIAAHPNVPVKDESTLSWVYALQYGMGSEHTGDSHLTPTVVAAAKRLHDYLGLPEGASLYRWSDNNNQATVAEALHGAAYYGLGPSFCREKDTF